MRYFILCITAVVACTALGQEQSGSQRRPFSAPTYYVIVEGQNWDPDGELVKFRGASNLPVGAKIEVTVSEFNGDAWKDYSGGACAPLSDEGFFEGQIQPKDGMKFRRSLILRATFTTYRCNQIASVLRTVGKKGEHLGERDFPPEEVVGYTRNPQIFQVSGWYYGLNTIARIE